MEPLWDLKISEYVEYLTRISSEYLVSLHMRGRVWYGVVT